MPTEVALGKREVDVCVSPLMRCRRHRIGQHSRSPNDYMAGVSQLDSAGTVHSTLKSSAAAPTSKSHGRLRVEAHGVSQPASTPPIRM